MPNWDKEKLVYSVYMYSRNYSLKLIVLAILVVFVELYVEVLWQAAVDPHYAHSCRLGMIRNIGLTYYSRCIAHLLQLVLDPKSQDKDQ